MTGRQVRFHPPALPLTPALRWMLLRAFGPPGATGEAAVPAAVGATPAGVLDLSRRFDVAARIAARQGRERLAADLAAMAAADGQANGATAPAAALALDGFVRERSAAAAATLRAMALVDQVAAAAAAAGIPVVFLKLAALELSGALAPGSRAGCDLDVLVPAERAGELRQALLQLGYRSSPLAGQEHQLAALQGPGGVVEVHRMMLGVRLGGRRSARLGDLRAAGLLRGLPQLPGDAAVPVPAVAVAHALVHGIAQHGWAPGSYSLLKMVGDLIDLGFAGTAAPAALPAAACADAIAWIARDVPGAEAAAARHLAAALAAGDDLAGWQSSPQPAAVLLRHILAGRLDPAYARALRLSLFRRQPSDRPQAVRLARAVGGAIWLSRARVDAIYGPPRHPLGYLGRQLGRPLDLLARLGRYARHAWRVRHRPAGGRDGPGRPS